MSASPCALLGLGMATFIPDYGLHGGGWRQPAADILQQAIAGGIRYIDTAAAYGEGERVLGGLAALIASTEVRICTKVAIGEDTDAETVMTEVAASLARLSCSRIDTLLAHSITTGTLQSSTLPAAWRAIKAQGLASRTGASTYGVTDACAALALPDCDTVQVEYSILNQEVVRAAVAQKRPGQEIVARSVLCKGLLTSGRAHAPFDLAPLRSTLAVLEHRAADWGFTVPELAIRFALDTPGIDVVLVGVASPAEVGVACAAASRPPLTADQFAALEACDCSALDAVHPERWTQLTAGHLS